MHYSAKMLILWMVLTLPLTLARNTNQVHCLTRYTTKSQRSVPTSHSQTTITKTATLKSTDTVTVTGRKQPTTTTTSVLTYYTTIYTVVGTTTVTYATPVTRTVTKTRTTTFSSTYTETTMVSTTVSGGTVTVPVPQSSWTPVADTLPSVAYAYGKRAVGSSVPYAMGGSANQVARAAKNDRIVIGQGATASKYPDAVTCITSYITTSMTTTVGTTTTTSTITKTVYESSTSYTTSSVTYVDIGYDTVYFTQSTTTTDTVTRDTTTTQTQTATVTGPATYYYPACDPSQGAIVDEFTGVDSTPYFGSLELQPPIYGIPGLGGGAVGCCEYCLYSQSNCNVGAWNPHDGCIFNAGATCSDQAPNFVFVNASTVDFEIFNGICEVWNVEEIPNQN